MANLEDYLQDYFPQEFVKEIQTSTRNTDLNAFCLPALSANEFELAQTLQFIDSLDVEGQRSGDTNLSQAIFELCHPQSCVVLDSQQICYIGGIKAAIVDVDDTQILGTGEFVHDGTEGRFARAVKSLIESKTGISIKFDEFTWSKYRKCTGKAEIEVCNEMARVAASQFEVSISGEELQQEARKQLELSWSDLVKNVSPAPGVRDLLLNCRAAKIESAVCSASSEEFVSRILGHFSLDRYFGAWVCSAEKKTAPGIFNGNPVRKACDDLNIPVSQACMIGDSISDYAAAALAGVPVVILRVGSERQEEILTGLFREIRRFQDQHDFQSLKSVPQLVFVPEFDSVRFVESKRDCPPQTLITRP